jgi:cobalamin synthase
VLEQDFRWSLYGIVTFAAASVIALFVIVRQLDFELPALIWFAVVAVTTSIVAAWLMRRHRQARFEAVTMGVTIGKTTGERVAGLITLGIAGAVAAGAMVLVSAIVAVILVIAACFGGGFKL